MNVRELREILEEFDGEMEVTIAEHEYGYEARNIERVVLNVKKDNPRLELISE